MIYRRNQEWAAGRWKAHNYCHKKWAQLNCQIKDNNKRQGYERPTVILQRRTLYENWNIILALSRHLCLIFIFLIATRKREIIFVRIFILGNIHLVAALGDVVLRELTSKPGAKKKTSIIPLFHIFCTSQCVIRHVLIGRVFQNNSANICTREELLTDFVSPVGCS